MTEKPECEYDIMGHSFKKYEGTLYHITGTRTVLHLAGDVHRKSVLDLACGYGFFGREFKKRGASRVVGVDISKKMIALARDESRKNNDDIEFYVKNVTEAGFLGHFDLVIAAFLFNYAETIQDLEKMFKTAAENLKPEGRLVACTLNPEYKLAKGNCTEYGITILSEELSGDKYKYRGTFDKSFENSLTMFKWSGENYENCIKKAGFSRFFWYKPMLLECDIKKYPEGFRDKFQQNCIYITLVCEF